MQMAAQLLSLYQSFQPKVSTPRFCCLREVFLVGSSPDRIRDRVAARRLLTFDPRVALPLDGHQPIAVAHSKERTFQDRHEDTCRESRLSRAYADHLGI